MPLSSLTLGGFFVPLNRGKLSEQPSLPFSFQEVQYILGAPVLGATSVWSESHLAQVCWVVGVFHCHLIPQYLWVDEQP